MNLLSLAELVYNYIHSKEQDLSLTEIMRGLEYLVYYAYLDSKDNLQLSDVLDAVSRFQQMFGLEVDGILGVKTYRAMLEPRCSMPDNLEEVGQLKKWNKKNLTYFIKNRDTDLPKDVYDAAIRQAWNNWEAVCGIRATQINNDSADIIIDIGSGSRDNFDGPSGTLAWAYLPPGNDSQLVMKFDIAETWIVDKNARGILIVNVATHEMGHLLGLTHSQVKSALMAPYYSASLEKPQDNDDIPRVVERYGKPTSVPSPSPAPTPEPTNPSNNTLHIEFDSNIKAIKMDGYRIFITSLK